MGITHEEDIDAGLNQSGKTGCLDTQLRSGNFDQRHPTLLVS